jgi:hypothetical protein
MLENNQNPIEVLKKVISKLFLVELNNFNFDKYDKKLPHALKEMYEIEAFFVEKDCAYETIGFFSILDRLIPHEKLKVEDGMFTFIQENQANWALKYGDGQVYFEDKIEPQNSRFLTQTIDEILLLFALQEVGFNIPNYFGLDYNTIAEITTEFENIEPIVFDKNYIGINCSYYIADGNCLVGQAGMNVLSTFDHEKYEHYLSKLKHYTF